MAGIIPNKGEGARAEATALAKRWYEEGELTVKEIVQRLMDRYQIAECTAYMYGKEARRELGMETVKEQLVIGMEATAASMRVARELELAARAMQRQAVGVNDLDKVSAAFRRAGQQYLGTAQAAIKLDVGEQMSDEEQAEILARAVVENRSKIPARVRRELAAMLEEERVH